MEDRQLDFNQPLLSVRTPKTHDNSRPPPYRTHLKSGPITNPGVVPFQWEHTPGRPKQQQIKPEKSPIAPKLPPGRHPNATHQNSYDANSPRARYQHENVENSKEVNEENENSDSEDSEGAYVDARDTLSRTESFFLNCSNTGLSELDGVQIEPSRSIETRDFMMDRFLPAAKAMASEKPLAPQYATRKQHGIREQGQRVKKVVVSNDKPSLRYGPSFANRYYEEEEGEESDVEENVPAICGLLPRFCLRNSLGRLSPVPAMSVRTRAPMSRAHIIQQRSSPSVSYSETESKSDMSEVKSMDKIQKAAANDDKTNLGNESGQLEIQLYCDVPKENIRPGIKGFGHHGNDFKTVELPLDQSSDKKFNSQSPVEKTLYIDTVTKVKSPGSRNEDHEIISKRAHQMNVIDSCHVDGIAKSPLNYNENYSPFPVAPPLPKSPSDSWLWRTLPSMSAKNLSLRTYHTQNQGSYKPHTNDAKWETIVKTTKEMLTTVPET